MTMTEIERLQKEVIACGRCPRLVEYCAGVARVKRRAFITWTYWGRPVPSFGDPRARLLIIGLAPGAHGANRTGRMFTGDSSGDFLYRALHQTGFATQPTSTNRDDGLELRGAYITAAVRCAPPENKPERAEMENCRPYLVRELALLTEVRVVVALGKIAFDSFLRVRPLEGAKFGHGTVSRYPDGCVLLASYHPSQQNTFTGKLTMPMLVGVFRKARRICDA